jgi:hypothetical protein
MCCIANVTTSALAKILSDTGRQSEKEGDDDMENAQRLLWGEMPLHDRFGDLTGLLMYNKIWSTYQDTCTDENPNNNICIQV